MPRIAGFYVPGKVQIVIGVPVGPASVPVDIPGLPEGVGFPFTATGRGTDEFATASRTTDSVTLEVGLDGEGVFNVTFDRSGTLTLTFMKFSFLNIALSAAHNAMQNPINPLLFTLPVKYNDPYAVNRSMTARDCVVQRPPDWSAAASEGENAWSLLAHETSFNHGARVF